MKVAVGALVKVRGREWVVLPDSDDELLMLCPLGGTDDESTGILVALEPVEPASFDLPDPSRVGDHRSCQLLRDAIRISSRASAGPFRSFARIAVEPRPYQLVPLLMALRLDPIRLLIADDVGIGKTIEACLVARELLDRGEITRMAVLCPPHLAEQWQVELRDKFHIDAEMVLPGTASRLERTCGVGQSLFDIYPHVIVSMDFIKSDRRRDEFVRTAPEMVIVDEAHTCAYGYEGRGGRHQRHLLTKQLASDPSRHLMLVTATPHSGKEEAFRSLLTLLKPEFADLPPDLTGQETVEQRRRLAAHFIQRRRGDIRHYMQAETPFPDREESEATYKLTAEYQRLFSRVLRFARETVVDPTGNRHRQRVRWWSALALLRSLASSPSAASVTLRNRAIVCDTETAEEADEIGRRTVFDIDTEDLSEAIDLTPGGDAAEEAQDAQSARRRLLEMAREADRLAGASDAKLIKAVELLKQFLDDGYHPIVFCRFIHTADYLARELESRLPRGTKVVSVTGALPPADREARIVDLATSPKRVLVCTDCLSEGINLQEHFDAVMHYDLSWSPTRHEQREGRVDRYGQPRPTIRVLTYYGIDNQIDGIVLDTLIRKHKTIRNSLGIAVPVPMDTNTVVEAIFEGLLLREQTGRGEGQQLALDFEEYLRPKKEELYTRWDRAADREKRSRSMFAQESIKVEDVARELSATRAALGSVEDVTAFTLDALRSNGATVLKQGDRYRLSLKEAPRALRDAVGGVETLTARFELPAGDCVEYLSRTHPFIEGLASYLIESSLDSLVDGAATRAGAIRTRSVETRTTILLLRLRHDVITVRKDGEQSQLAEECHLVGFRGAPESAQWLTDEEVEALLHAEPAANILPEQASGFVRKVVEGVDSIRPRLDQEARGRASALLDAHRRVREAARMRGISYRVEPKPPVDVVGIYVLLPAAS